MQTITQTIHRTCNNCTSGVSTDYNHLTHEQVFDGWIKLLVTSKTPNDNNKDLDFCCIECLTEYINFCKVGSLEQEVDPPYDISETNYNQIQCK